MNLVEARWIPVARVGGGRDRVGLAACFTEADRISRVRAGSVLEDRAVERLLIAICLRAGGPARAANYLRHHQDQFQADRFCQYSVRAASPKASHGMDRLVLDPAGAAAPASLSQGDAVRAMLARMLFDPSGIRTGLADDPMSSGSRSMPIGPALLAAIPTVIVHPGTLAGMLAQNTPPDGWRDGDMPVWEDDPSRPRGAYTADEAGIGRLLLWPGRRLRLRTATPASDDDASGPQVTGCLLANGDKLDLSSVLGVDPHGLWEITRTRGKIITRQDHGCPWDALVDRGGPAPIGLARLLEAVEQDPAALPGRVSVSLVATRLGPGYGTHVQDVDHDEVILDPARLASRRAALPDLEALVETIVWANVTMRGALTRRDRADLAGWETKERRRVNESLAPIVTGWLAGENWDKTAADEVIIAETSRIEKNLTRPATGALAARLANTIRKRSREFAKRRGKGHG